MTQEKILILTKTLDVAHQLDAEILTPNSYDTTISTHPEEAIRLLKTSSLKVCIVSLSTSSLLRFLAQLEDQRLELPVILLCEEEQQTVPLEVLSHDIKGYIKYPFEVEKTLDTLQKILKTTDAERAYQALIDELTAFNASLEERIREATVLQGIGRSVNLTLDLDAVLNRVVETATSATKAEEGYLMLLEPETGELYIRAAKDMNDRRARVIRQKVNDSLAGTVVQSGQPIILSGNLNKRFKVKTGYVVQALLNVPLKVGERVIGILGVDNPSRDTSFTLDDLGRLSALADKTATTIENIRVYTQASKNLTRRLEELYLLQSIIRDLNAVTDRELIAQLVLSQARKATQAEVGVLGWFGQGEPLWVSQGAPTHQFVADCQTTTAWRWYQKELEEIIASGEPRLISAAAHVTETDGPAQKFPSRLTVPIKRGKIIEGIINLESAQPNQFNNDDLRFLQTIANHAALTLQTSGLTEMMTYQQEQLSLLMNGIEDAVWLVNTKLETLDINPIACHLLGWQAKKVVGQNCATIWPENGDSGHRKLGRYLEQAMAIRGMASFTQGVTLTLENGHINLVEGAAYPLFNRKRVIGAMAIFREISPERDIESLHADFISMASHNLRTPLMTIQASLDYVLEAKPDEAKNKQLLLEVRSQSQKIALFLRELLDMSQLALGKETSVNIKPVNILPLLRSIVADGEMDMPCILEAPKILPLISTDEIKVEIILHNLLAHAKRRSKMGDVLKIIAEKQEKEIIISIVDNGEPISPQHYPQIFWHIYPLEGNKSNGSMPYGYGIGLFTTRRLVELLGGKIWLSQPNAQGVSVNFTLPIWR